MFTPMSVHPPKSGRHPLPIAEQSGYLQCLSSALDSGAPAVLRCVYSYALEIAAPPPMIVLDNVTPYS